MTTGRAALTLTALVLLAALVAAACESAEAPGGATPTAPVPTASAVVLAFAAGGSIYGIDVTGHVRQLLAGDRDENWLSSPSFSPDGDRLAYTCGFDICVADADGRNARVLVKVADLATPTGAGASSPSLGAQSVAWSPDGEFLAYTLARIDGGAPDLWVMRFDGSNPRMLYEGGSVFYRPAWLGPDRIAVAEGDMLTYFRRTGGSEETLALPPEAAPFAEVAIPGPNGRWLVGAVTREEPVLYGTGAGMETIAAGVSPALSPDGRWAAYFRGDAVYVVSTAGGDERLLADAVPIGGRDRFSGNPADCAGDPPSCSYRLPSLGWNPRAYDPAAFEPTPVPTATPPAGAKPVVGLFDAPRASEPHETVALGTPPAAFPPWDGVSTTLYDMDGLSSVGLGPGGLGSFSPDETRMVWVSGDHALAGGEAWLLDLRSMERTRLGAARLAFFLDDQRIAITAPGGNETEILNLERGERTPAPFIAPGPPSGDQRTPEGYLLRRRDSPRFDRGLYTLEDPTTGATLLYFEAYKAVPAGPGVLAVATVPRPDDPSAPLWQRTGTVNVFLVDIATGKATFVATSHYADPNWPLDANERYVMWTEGYCAVPQGKTRLYDRATSRLIELDASLWATFTPKGLIADGAFGPKAFIDPETWQYRAVIRGAGDTSASASYRYVTAGQWGGHGGLCG